MKTIRGLVVATLLAIWCFPAISSAKTLPAADPAPLPGLVTSTSARTEAPAAASTASEASDLSTREQQSRNLQDFKGGYAVIYVGSGVVLVLVIVLLILLI